MKFVYAQHRVPEKHKVNSRDIERYGDKGVEYNDGGEDL